ncbi:hypothetical protein F7725_027129 [Dissostichus mawsoni]|uniref:Ig-like domain-containing protein n=1 Tax=Dissostichus mawsoni TaxID=36200 RepID=A0A7J5XCA5_DISMA|nr:hypothetical protein F7725_027129 [Dissostichus mawsoni]
MTVSSEIIFDLTPSDDIQVAFTKSCQILLAITNSKRRSTRVCVISGIRTGTVVKQTNWDCFIREHNKSTIGPNETGAPRKLMPGSEGIHKLIEEVDNSRAARGQMGREHDPKHRPDAARLQRHTLLSASLSSRKHKPGPPGAAERTHTALRMQDGSWNPPEASSEGGGPHLDPELEGEEIHRSLDLALEAFGGTFEDPESSKTAENPQTKASSPSEGEGAASEAPPLIKHASIEVEKPTPCLKPLPPVYKQDKPRLLHEGLELNDRAASTSEFCSRAATFIEELSSIFRGSAHQEDDASSPDSGQEVAEGSPIRLECRVTGTPPPLVRWFCEGRELHSSPDIQILSDEDLQTLVINEAFEDDTGRYTCVASNSTGADNTSAEVYIEGASSTDSEGEGGASKTPQETCLKRREREREREEREREREREEREREREIEREREREREEKRERERERYYTVGGAAGGSPGDQSETWREREEGGNTAGGAAGGAAGGTRGRPGERGGGVIQQEEQEGPQGDLGT